MVEGSFSNSAVSSKCLHFYIAFKIVAMIKELSMILIIDSEEGSSSLQDGITILISHAQTQQL